jgi:putative FmdB family regulatory protein
MPIYEYQCEKCDHCFEILVFGSDDDPVTCPQCNEQQVKRLLSSTCFINASASSSCTANTSKGLS